MIKPIRRDTKKLWQMYIQNFHRLFHLIIFYTNSIDKVSFVYQRRMHGETLNR